MSLVRLALVSAAALLLATAAVSQHKRAKPVADVTELMQAMVIPASDALFNVPRAAPSTEQEWAAVRNHAIVLAESGNLLMFGERAEPTDAWMGSSRALVEAGEAALRAAKDKDADAIGEIGNQIIQSCEQCHEEHWKR